MNPQQAESQSAGLPVVLQSQCARWESNPHGTGPWDFKSHAAAITPRAHYSKHCYIKVGFEPTSPAVPSRRSILLSYSSDMKEESKIFAVSVLIIVQAVGLEPTRASAPGILSAVCLPLHHACLLRKSCLDAS